MALTDIDRRRAKPLDPATMDKLARNYRTLSAQYPLFAEAPMLTDSTDIGVPRNHPRASTRFATRDCAPMPPAPRRR